MAMYILKALCVIGILLNVILMAKKTKELRANPEKDPELELNGEELWKRGLQPKNLIATCFIGFFANFLDTLGIGSFAPSSAGFKLTKSVDDILVPGTLNVGDTVPVCVEAFLFFGFVEMDILTLVLMIVVSILGSFVMADIPGLIEGAWQGTGLGHQFLRHVERCRMLVHIVDVSGSEGRDPKEDFITINNELAKFNPELAERPMVVAGNKCDMATDEQIADFKKFVEDQGYDFFPIMAAIRYDVDPLLKKIQEMLSKLPPITHYEAEPAPIVTVDDFDDHSVTIKNVNGIYTVEADWLLQVMKGINFDDYESLNYFQKVLINGGVIDALRKKGCSDGDTVSIYELEFDFMD